MLHVTLLLREWMMVYWAKLVRSMIYSTELDHEQDEPKEKRPVRPTDWQESYSFHRRHEHAGERGLRCTASHRALASVLRSQALVWLEGYFEDSTGRHAVYIGDGTSGRWSQPDHRSYAAPLQRYRHQPVQRRDADSHLHLADEYLHASKFINGARFFPILLFSIYCIRSIWNVLILGQCGLLLVTGEMNR